MENEFWHSGNIRPDNPRTDPASMPFRGYAPHCEDNLFSGYQLPGFIDVHLHGAFGWDFSFGNPEKINRMLDGLLTTGVTGLAATLITCPDEQRERALQDISRVALTRKNPPFIHGIYLEGPFLSSARRGSHPERLLKKPDIKLVERWQVQAKGLIKLVTVAPELDGSLEFIRELSALGIRPTIGHTDAEHSRVFQAMNAGAAHVTHLFNAMRPFTHRDPTAVSAALGHKQSTVELIGDGIHISPEIVSMVFSLLGPKRIAVITDGVCPLGLPNGLYDAYNVTLEQKDGRCTFSGGHLFGGGTPMNACMNVLLRNASIPLSELTEAVSTTPARLLGITVPDIETFFDRQFQWLATRFGGLWYWPPHLVQKEIAAGGK